jgi:hypothetical protein
MVPIPADPQWVLEDEADKKYPSVAMLRASSAGISPLKRLFLL